MITKAIIPVAGFGTRRLPIAKAIEKCMLPILNRPLVDYVVEDCLKAGIREFYFVVDQDSTQLEAYYSANPRMKAHLEQHGKHDMVRYVEAPRDVKMHYIRQPDDGRYGTAIPVGLVVPELQPGESVVVMMGDDFIYNADGSSEVARLIEDTPEGGNGMLGVNIPREEVSNYGVIHSNHNKEFIRIVEKPLPNDAPSTLINVSKYIFNYDLLQTIANYANIDLSGEYYITEPINQYVLNGGKVHVTEAQGRYLDGGSVDNWLHANNVVAGWTK